jgi:iron complex transport system ATP-binding protein
MKKRPPLLDFDRVRMMRGGKVVLDGMTFRIDVGENVAILGPNGSGKSSLLKLLTRELYPVANDGEYRMRIMGQDRWELFELRRHLGIVSMDLQHDFARGVLRLGGRRLGFFSSVGLWSNHRVTRTMEKKAWRVLEHLEVDHLADRPDDRDVLGRGAAHAPRPGADPRSGRARARRAHDEPGPRLVREFRESMRKLARSGTSVILVTHTIEE